MADYNAAGATELVVAGLGMAQPSGESVRAPAFSGEFECVGPDGVRWTEKWHNVVVNAGRAHLANKLFASAAGTTQACFLHIHGIATNGTASNHVWSNISGSQVVSYGTALPRMTFASATDATTMSASYAYTFTSNAATQAANGAAVLFYTASTLATSEMTGANANVLLYSEGVFGTPRTVNANDTLNVTVNLSFNS